MKYEYLIKSREEMYRSKSYQFGGAGRYSLAGNLGTLGAEGWRLVTVVDDLYHFEREIPQKSEVVVSQLNSREYVAAEDVQKFVTLSEEKIKPLEGSNFDPPARPWPSTAEDADGATRHE
jgi:hypothetical protein